MRCLLLKFSDEQLSLLWPTVTTEVVCPLCASFQAAVLQENPTDLPLLTDTLKLLEHMFLLSTGPLLMYFPLYLQRHAPLFVCNDNASSGLLSRLIGRSRGAPAQAAVSSNEPKLGRPVLSRAAYASVADLLSFARLISLHLQGDLHSEPDKEFMEQSILKEFISSTP